MNKIIKAILITYIIIYLPGCTDIIETDISNNKINLISPGKDVEVDCDTISFFWDEIDDATKYQLQVVSPNFDNVRYFLLDTITSKNRYTITLNANSYEWRVRAKNDYYTTAFFYNNFTIVDSLSK